MGICVETCPVMPVRLTRDRDPINSRMKPAGVVGILLIVLGVIALAYQGIRYTTRSREKVLDIGPIEAHATVERQKTIPLPPILGIAALAGGIVLVVVASKK
jgi:hypothetical protein